MFENFQFGNWCQVPRLCLFCVIFLPNCFFSTAEDQGPIWLGLQVGKLGQQVHQVNGSGPPWEHGLAEKYYHLY